MVSSEKTVDEYGVTVLDEYANCCSCVGEECNDGVEWDSD